MKLLKDILKTTDPEKGEGEGKTDTRYQGFV